jgi:ATP-binding cassette subfamily F protein 3
MAESPIEPFSGGEKSRLALALLVRRRPNLLLLDEPTNHLDLDMRHALTKALAEYEGSLVLVSHDRALLRTVCDGFLLVADGRTSEFDGDVDDYLTWLSARREVPSTADAKAGRAAGKASRKESRGNAVADRQAKLALRRPLLREAEELEREMEAWQEERRALDAGLADPSLYAGDAGSKLRDITKRQTELLRLLEAAEARWLEVHTELEAIGEVS